jgi:hypothetical protein
VSAIDETLTLEEVAALVCSTLEQHDVRVVLSGGSVVSIYSNNAYESLDLDFIATGLARKVDAAMLTLGFERSGRHWKHAKTRYWVEFPAGPVAVGDQTVTEFAERTTRHGVLRLLAPTECVMDRLAAYYHWDDLQCLDQALAVASAHPIDLERIAAWSRREARSERFREFERRLRERS